MKRTFFILLMLAPTAFGCGVDPMEQTNTGALAEDDETLPDDGSYYDDYPVRAAAGMSISAKLSSYEFDPYVFILDKDSNKIAENDNISDEDRSALAEVTAPYEGVYYIVANSRSPGEVGQYTLEIKTVSE